MAYCVNCGDQLADEVKFCPGCGTQKIQADIAEAAPSQTETPNATPAAAIAAPLLSQDNGNASGAPTDAPPPKRRTFKKPMIIAGIILLLFLLLIGFANRLGKSLDKKFEDVAGQLDAAQTNTRDETSSSGSGETYEDYKREKDAKEAAEKAAEDAEEAAEMSEERDAFFAAKVSGRITDFGKYAEKWPYGEYDDEAEALAFESLNRQKSIGAFKTFKKYFPYADMDDYRGKGVWENGGDRYEGDMRGSDFHGTGIYYWANGDRYEGDWVNDKQTGTGQLYWTNGSRYEGDFIDGERTGRGTKWFANGEWYKGQCKSGRAHGEGTLSAQGQRFTGRFANGVPVGKILSNTGSGYSIGEQNKITC